ncbi:MAG: hypothetical protein ACQEW9_06335 [Bacteroidota bacterium]|uniref:Uncharacterized protein n=1 Tax=Algoriphagus faecimaris TaxID=686796 RepID=A0A1G6P505_9BACT|nr:hypothetical protein [Algoriphagus faecimaris]SDC74694.1 hypothetical protein SAMN04488104_100533 [Algoriphagus faecimaris]
MKFPSIFRTASHSRFDIKPRYYDPVKEELEQRTSRIKQELEAEGKLGEITEEERLKRYETGIRGAFAQHQGIRERNTSIMTSTAMIRTLIFLFLITGLSGYIYLGPVIFEYLLYLAMIVVAIYYFTKLKNNRK